MTTSVHTAAEELYRRIKAPKGAVNTLALHDSQGPLIRVLVDPMFWSHVSGLPSTFEGYRVVVEKRHPSVAFH